MKNQGAIAECANCGKKTKPLIWYDGKWWCPGACDVSKGKKK